MSNSILFSDTPEHFYQQLRECIQQTIKQELSMLKKEDNDVYLKKHEVCKMLQVMKRTVEARVLKVDIGPRVFFRKQEILGYLTKINKCI